MVPGLFSTVMPCRRARPERGRTCASVPSGSARIKPVGTRRARARSEFDRPARRHRGQQIHAGRAGR